MRKRYMFLMMLFAQLITGNAFAADPPKAEYDAAMAAIEEGSYYIYTEIDGVNYYLDAEGYLTDDRQYSAQKFAITKVKGGALYDVGLFINPGTGKYFTNTNLENSKAILHFGHLRLDSGNNRNDWERQVPYLQDGKFAIRSCNTAYGESSWNDAGRAFWTYEVEDADEDDVYEAVYGADGMPIAGYTYDAAYIWQFEAPAGREVFLDLFNSVYDKYSDWHDAETEPETLNIGTEFGQYNALETFQKLCALMAEVDVYLGILLDDEEFDPDSDPEFPTLEQAKQIAADADSLYDAILASEVPYTIPANGYYRIYAHNRYKSTYDESGFVDKAMAASFYDEHMNKAVMATVKKDYANYLWKLTQVGDSVMIQNAGMGTYVSLSKSDKDDNKVYLTDNINDASHLVFNYAVYDNGNLNPDYVYPDGEEAEKDIFAMRLASTKTGKNGRYIHQMSHSSVADETSPWGNYGVDQGKELELGFWLRTFDNNRTNDLNASEWYLMPVDDAEAEEIISKFENIKTHDLLVAKNNALRAEVLAALNNAKDSLRTELITSASQMDNTCGDPSEGTNLGNLIDKNINTFWHTTWHGGDVGMMYTVTDEETGEEYERNHHYLQINNMEGMVGGDYLQLYFAQRNGADWDHPAELVLLGTNEEDPADTDWVTIETFTVTNTSNGAESYFRFSNETPYKYVRIIATKMNASFRTFWHASEIQIIKVESNPNSQYNALGELSTNLEDEYNRNLGIADADITDADYEALLKAYNAFFSGMVDPTELRNALSAYANATVPVVEGNNPGEWKDVSVAEAFKQLYAEIKAYDAAGRYTADQNHKYAVMLKAMNKAIAEQANGIDVNKWYRIQIPTEEQFDAYSFSKSNLPEVENIGTQFGNYAVAGDMVQETQTSVDDQGNETEKDVLVDIASYTGEDIREGMGLYFVDDELIEDKDASTFRFIKKDADATDYTSLLTDVKENMTYGLEFGKSFTRGNALITSATQFSSNASYPGNDGGKLEEGVLIDGNKSTYWHSDYSKKYCAIPYLQVALNEPVSGYIQVDIARRNTSNGHVVRMYVVGSNDAETWTNIGYIETPFGNVSETVSSQAINLNGTYSHLRFLMTQRYGTDGGSNIEFDPFAEGLTADDYNKKFTYFHASEFQIYPLTLINEPSAATNALQTAYDAANKIVLKDASAEDFASAFQTYKAFRDEFNAAEGKTILPAGKEKADPSYAIQNKATGLFVNARASNDNNVLFSLIPTFFTHATPGYSRNVLHAYSVDGRDCAALHTQNWNHRLVTWNVYTAESNSGLIIAEADEEYVAPETFTFTKDIKPGRINNWCNSVTITPVSMPVDGATLYTPLGSFTNDEGEFFALKTIDNVPAGEPVFCILGDTVYYDSEAEDEEAYKFTFSANEELVLKGDTINGFIGCLDNHTLLPNEMYFSGNHVVCIAQTGYYVRGGCIVANYGNITAFDPNDSYDFAICLDNQGSIADGVESVPAAIEKISQPGNVYTVDGKLLRTGATLNSLKSLGKGMYILNGVKVLVK